MKMARDRNNCSEVPVVPRTNLDGTCKDRCVFTLRHPWSLHFRTEGFIIRSIHVCMYSRAHGACSQRAKKLYAHPGVRVLKYAPPIHSIPLWPNQPRTFTSHSIQAQSLHSVRVRVRVGWSASGATAKKKFTYVYPVLHNWYQVFWYSISSR